MTLRWSLVLTVAMAASCARPETKRDTDLVRDFVQEFYDWYVPIAVETSSGRPADIALQRRAPVFDASLARELKEDFDAQAKADEIVGLDFDPFLAAQDPCERYEVMTVRAEAGSYLVDVRGVGGCEKHDKADVVVDVVSRNGAWLFTNFHYPGPQAIDLRTILKRLRDDRH